MKGDFSRDTFDAEKHYCGVRMQQGRLLIDADFNEAQSIVLDLVESTTADIVGCCGGPAANAGFGVLSSINALGTSDPTGWFKALGLSGQRRVADALARGDFLLSAGRYYVGGIQCRIENPVLFSHQPDRPILDVPLSEGDYVVYLDVWRRHLTALDDDSIREVALGGADTTTRVKTVWQVRLAPLSDRSQVETACATRTSYGRLGARAAPTDAESPVPASAGGYTGLENNLYRVEIHDSSQQEATFKWSRDNGSRVFLIDHVLASNPPELRLDSESPRAMGFSRLEQGDWVEVSNDELELEGIPAQLLKVVNVTQRNVVTLNAPLDSRLFPDGRLGRRPKLRCWDGVGHASPATAGTWLPLEFGIDVTFTSGEFKVGDHWVIPARTSQGDIDWPDDHGMPALLQPREVRHQHCPLAIIRVQKDGVVESVEDLRVLFRPLAQRTDRHGCATGAGQPAPRPDKPRRDV